MEIKNEEKQIINSLFDILKIMIKNNTDEANFTIQTNNFNYNINISFSVELKDKE